MQRQAIWQGFCCEEPATGAHGLLANPLAAAGPPSLADSGVSATTSDPSPSPQHSDMGLNLDVSMGFTDSDTDAEGVTDDEVIVPSPTPSATHPHLRSSGMHEHPVRTYARLCRTRARRCQRVWTTPVRAQIEVWTSTYFSYFTQSQCERWRGMG